MTDKMIASYSVIVQVNFFERQLACNKRQRLGDRYLEFSGCLFALQSFAQTTQLGHMDATVLLYKMTKEKNTQENASIAQISARPQKTH